MLYSQLTHCLKNGCLNGCKGGIQRLGWFCSHHLDLCEAQIDKKVATFYVALKYE